MGGAEMGDVSALEKQLAVKTRLIAELQARYSEKARRLHDYEDELDRKDRAIYYLERGTDARSRELGKLRLKSSNLEVLASKQRFSATIDAGEAKCEDWKATVAASGAAVREAKLAKAHAQMLQETYENLVKKITKGVTMEQIVAELQSELNTIEQKNADDKQFLNDIKVALTEQNNGFETLRGQSRYLEQYRVDAIFRVFTLKGQIKILKEDLKAAGKEA